MGITRVQYTDSGAIQLCGINGRTNTWAQKHWVADGGWANPFSGTNHDVFIPPGSVGNGVVIRHDSAVSGAAQRATYRAFESASSLTTLVDPYPTISQSGDTASTLLVSSTADATARPWWMVRGDFTNAYDSFVILVVQFSSTQTEFMFYGKPWLDNPADTHGWLIGTRNSASNTSQAYLTAGTNSASPNQKFFWQRSFNGLIKSTTSLIIGAYGGGGTGYIGMLLNTEAYPPAGGGKLRRNPIQVGCSGNTANAITIGNNKAWRGILPNLWAGAHISYTGLTNGDDSEDSSYDPTALFLIFGSTFSPTTLSNGVILMEVTDTWKPQGFV